jgi:hypothetical protein
MKYIERSWEGYRKLLPADASETQIRETRQAFYAGAATIFTGMMFIMDGGDEPTDADMKRMMDIQIEIDAFGQELDKRVFGNQEH